MARRGAEHAAVLAAYLVLTIAMTYPVARHAAHAIPIDHQITDWYPGDGDPWHYLWAFWYFKRALSAFPPHLFWTDLVFYPIGFEIPFITGIGAILVPAGLLEPVAGLTLTYNLLWLSSFVLAGYAIVWPVAGLLLMCQVAHCVEAVAFPVPRARTGRRASRCRRA